MAGSFGSKSPSLPSGEPSLHEPCSLDGQIGQLLIRQPIQERINLGPRCLCTQAAQRHRLGRERFLLDRLRRDGSTNRLGRRRRCPEQVSLVAHREPGFAPCRLQRFWFR